MDKEATIRQAQELRRQDELEASQALLLELLDAHPEDALVLFEVGGAYDVLEEVDTAIQYYKEALLRGLRGAERRECLICLGINQRAVGEFETAVLTLEDAAQQFPDSTAIRAFLALAHYSNGDDDKAVQLLLDLLLQTTQDEEIKLFADTLDFYKDNLDEVWE
ncbi:MAG: tetratricopeptide repeat protein [Anaerolineales bacterium]|nr:tetratricopeptide repeat protein [Anaerolineales bacterium]